MADQQIINDATDVNAQIRADVQSARNHKVGRQDLEVMAGYDQIIQSLTPRTEETGTVQPRAVASHGNADELRQSDSFKREVGAVESMRDVAYESSRDRIHIIKVNGEPDARDNLRNSYNDLIKHMQDHPEQAAQDGAVMRSFQLAANGAALKQQLNQDQRDNLLANMLHAHVNGVSADRVSAMHDLDVSGPSR